MNILGAIVVGMVGTVVISSVMAMAPMMGIMFALVYTFLWSIGIGSATWVNGLLFGGVHWLVAGLVMGMIPMMHVGIKRGEVKAPGLWMTNNGGMMAFVGGLIGHLVFGVVVALVYNLF